MIAFRIAGIATSLCIAGLFTGAVQAAEAPAAAAAAASKPEEPATAPFPADKSVAQSIQLGGRTLSYTATIGSLPVQGKDGKPIADVMFAAYTMPGADRPVTFAINGGPGASSVYLNLGAIGPKRVRFGNEGDAPSDPAQLKDNPGTWLDFTDIVFIDPVGTGFSRSRVNEAESKKAFYSTTADIEYLSRVIYDWLLKNGRLTSRKYLVGESYGGFRGPRITATLQTQLGIGLNGLVLVSPYLEPSADSGGDFSPLPWMQTLGSIAAAHLERQGKLSDAAMREVIDYVRGEYASDLLKGRSDPKALDRIVQRVTALTGLDPAFVRRSGGRLETQAYLREVYRNEGKLGSRYDSNVTAWDPFPFAPQQRTDDPMLMSLVAPTTTAMVNFITQTVGWKYSGAYYALSYDVGRAWNWEADKDKGILHGSVEELRQSVAIDPRLQVLVVHGWTDLSCPFMTSLLIVDQLPVMGDANRVRFKAYAGGHMFYSRPDSMAALRQDAQQLYGVK
ncbi:S10 family peptidase [Burkholderiaceae bacterium UC74_6]